MRDRPSAAELLAIARKTLEERILPALPEDRRYEALMIGAAMGIAEREAAVGEGAQTQERAQLAALYREPEGPGERLAPYEGESLAHALIRLNRRFAADIRSGVFDAPDQRRTAALRLLRDSIAARLAENNPRYPK